MKRVKLAFGCTMRVGKDTACDYLKDKYGGEKLSFAEPLYDILHYAQHVCGFPQEKDRKFLMWIGTEWARERQDDVFVQKLLGKVTNSSNYYVSDLRFYNEFKLLKDEGFLCVKIVKSDAPKSDHSSEKSLNNLPDDAWDYIIENDNDLETFYSKLDEIMITSSKAEIIG